MRGMQSLFEKSSAKTFKKIISWWDYVWCTVKQYWFFSKEEIRRTAHKHKFMPLS